MVIYECHANVILGENYRSWNRDVFAATERSSHDSVKINCFAFANILTIQQHTFVFQFFDLLHFFGPLILV